MSLATDESRPEVSENAASADPPAAATFEELLGREPRRATVLIDIAGQNRALRFVAIEPDELDALKTAHPPTQAALEKYRTEISQLPPDVQRVRALVDPPPAYDRRTFLPALIARCSDAPKMTAEQVAQLVHSAGWSVAEINELFDVCLGLCTASSVAQLGKGSEPTDNSGPPSATA